MMFIPTLTGFQFLGYQHPRVLGLLKMPNTCGLDEELLGPLKILDDISVQITKRPKGCLESYCPCYTTVSM